MKNLAHNSEADISILEELYLAGISAVKIEAGHTEVPYSYIGKLGKWTFKRAWSYWRVNVEEGEKGLPLTPAIELHNKKNPIKNEILGKIIRSGGDCTSPSPDGYTAQPIYDAETIAQMKLIGAPFKSLKSMGLGDDETEYPSLNYGEIAKLCNEGKLNIERYVDTYHIDGQIGLNEFVKFVKDGNYL